MKKLSKVNRARFRVKIKSLAEEARIIRHEEKRLLQAEGRGILHHHRVSIVREEQRATLLAYAYARGVPYRAVEPFGSKAPNENAIARILKSLAFITNPNLKPWIAGVEIAAA